MSAIDVGILGRIGYDLYSEEPNVPLRRMAIPSDVASAILYLSSDLSSFVNGHTLIVDGGVIAKFGYATP